MMGLDRIADHRAAGAEVLTSADMSCLMHLDGLIRRQERPIRVMHVAEMLAEAMDLDKIAPRRWSVDDQLHAAVRILP